MKGPTPKRPIAQKAGSTSQSYSLHRMNITMQWRVDLSNISTNPEGQARWAEWNALEQWWNGRSVF